MKKSGAVETARKALLDTLEALEMHLEALVLVGAQAVYLHTQDFISEVAPATVDADFALDVTKLESSPDIELVLLKSNFAYSETGNPGQWVTPEGIPVDIMVPRKTSGRIGKGRSPRLEGHSNKSVRITQGLEGCVVSYQEMIVTSLSPQDTRSFQIKVANGASIIIAKCFKIAEHLEQERKIESKDSFDVYRLLSHLPIQQLVNEFNELLTNDISREVTLQGLDYFKRLFTAGTVAPGVVAVGVTVQGVGNVEVTKASALNLASQLLQNLDLRKNSES